MILLQIRQSVEISMDKVYNVLVKKLKIFRGIKKFCDLLDTAHFLIYNDLV